MATRSIRTECDAVLPGPPDAVWAEVAAVQRRPQWLSELHRVEDAPERAAVGDRFRGESRIFLHHFLGASEVCEATPGESLSEEVYLGARMRSSWTFEPEGDGRTRVVHHIDIDFPAGPAGIVLRAVLRWRMRRLQRDSLRNLAQLLGGR